MCLCDAALEAQKLRAALQIAMSVSRAGNLFFQETEIWATYKTNRPLAAACISACVGVVALLASLLEPYMPSFSRNVLKQLNLSSPMKLTDDIIQKTKAIADLVPEGHLISSTEPSPLFRKILDKEVDSLRARFAGSQSERTKTKEKTADGKKETTAQKSESAAAQKPRKTAKGDSSGGDGAPKKKSNAKDDRNVDISRIDLRVGRILKAWRHPDAESLYVEEIDVGEPKPRTVVSGLVKFIPEDALQDRHVVLVCNLKPANMRGVRSEAMVLAATSKDGNVVELVEPPMGSNVGDRVQVEGFEGQPDEILNPKKKVWDTVQVDLATNEKLNACYRGIPLSTGHGPCKVASVVGGSIK